MKSERSSGGEFPRQLLLPGGGGGVYRLFMEGGLMFLWLKNASDVSAAPSEVCVCACACVDNT